MSNGLNRHLADLNRMASWPIVPGHVRRHQARASGQCGQQNSSDVPSLLTRSHSPRSASLSPSPRPSEASACRAITTDLRQARTPPPPRHCVIAHAHCSTITSSTSPTRHCLSSNQGKGLRAIIVAAIAAVRHRAPSSLVANPIHRSSYLFLC